MKIPGLIRTVLFFCVLYAGNSKLSKLQQHTVHDTVPVVYYEREYLSTEQKELILHSLYTHHEQLQSAEQCIMRVQQQFPYVAAGSGLFMPGSLVEYHFTIRKPVCCVNGDYVLTDDGIICIKDCYDEKLYAQLPHISIERAALQHEPTLHAIAAAIVRIDRAILDTYHVTWHAPQHGVLAYRNNTPFKIICDVLHVPTHTVLDTCNQIYAQMMDDIMHHKGDVIADIRFANQVVVYRNMKGR